ncbi:hypothetical protein BGZ57DRAFT_926148 [Hyaloscypha finlandica]|nr:hypothetical protein BGZ57DRAFT_926148 [Hyaloscypha finlandica]
MGLLNLSNPLLLNVVIRLDTPESPDICNVTLVCKRFNLITTPLAYREVNMTPNWPVIMPEAGVPPWAAGYGYGNGNGTRGHVSSDGYYSHLPPSIILPVTTETLCQNAVIVLVDRIRRKVILIALHKEQPLRSFSRIKRPRLVKALVLVEAAGPPFR